MDVRAPSCAGDTLDVEVRVMRLTSKRDRGLVRTENCMVKHRGQTVLVCTPLRMPRRRPAGMAGNEAGGSQAPAP